MIATTPALANGFYVRKRHEPTGSRAAFTILPGRRWCLNRTTLQPLVGPQPEHQSWRGLARYSRLCGGGGDSKGPARRHASTTLRRFAVPWSVYFKEYKQVPGAGLAATHSNPICRLASAGLVRGNASEPAHHPEPSGTDADRQCGFARHARVWRAWNFAALDRGNTFGDIMG